LLASIALCLATTVILKMHLGPSTKVRRPAYALVTLLPLLWLLTVTMTAGTEKIFSNDPKIGFLTASAAAMVSNHALALNYRLDAVVTGLFMLMVAIIFLCSAREWVLLLARHKLAELKETPAIWLPEYAVAEARPFHLFSLFLLGLMLLKELSGEAAMERARPANVARGCAHSKLAVTSKARRREIYLQVTEKRFKGINRCC
jgi:hypothetical protein